MLPRDIPYLSEKTIYPKSIVEVEENVDIFNRTREGDLSVALSTKGTIHAHYQTVHPDFSLWWIHGLWQHYLYTGDTEWIHKYYYHAVKCVHTFTKYVDEDGLICDMPYNPFLDWADLEKRGQCATLNALYYGTLELVEKMADIKQDKYMMDQVAAARSAMRESFIRRLWNSEKHCFMDANIDAILSDRVSEHANMSAILWGLCDEEQVEWIIQQIFVEQKVRFTEAQPFFTAITLQALDLSGRFDLALELIRKRWGERMVKKGATSTYEEWGVAGSRRIGNFTSIIRTQSHAWSAYPAEFLSRRLAGIDIVDAGCKRLRISPKQTDFDYSIIFPTPLGKVTVVSKFGFAHVTEQAYLIDGEVFIVMMLDEFADHTYSILFRRDLELRSFRLIEIATA